MTKPKATLKELEQNSIHISKKTFNYFQKLMNREITIIQSNYNFDDDTFCKFYQVTYLVIQENIVRMFLSFIKDNGCGISYEKFIKQMLDETKMILEMVVKEFK